MDAPLNKYIISCCINNVGKHVKTNPQSSMNCLWGLFQHWTGLSSTTATSWLENTFSAV